MINIRRKMLGAHDGLVSDLHLFHDCRAAERVGLQVRVGQKLMGLREWREGNSKPSRHPFFGVTELSNLSSSDFSLKVRS